MRKAGKKLKITLAVILSVIVLTAVGCGIYLQDYYRADPSAIEVISREYDTVTVTDTVGRQIVFAPENPVAGLIFYPGGKVQYESYAPLCLALAEENILCVLVHMPGNLAVLDINAADGIPEKYPEISDWYIAGHSLGGSMAASYAAKHTEEYKGIILLAAYSTADLTESNLKVLSVYGTEDKVLKHDSYLKNLSNLPEDFTEYVVEGGCHAYFGNYGMQNGDGSPGITREEQQAQTIEVIINWINRSPVSNNI